ncbi:MAG: M28 family metallopeptidase [Planctomycetota bacterium]|nr:M28 family metallopeptidase [Planctomycetota bacterium]
MSRTAIATALIAALAACFGVTIARQMQQQPSGGGGTTRAQQRPIDKSNPLELEPIHAPKDLGEKAMAHARTIVAFGPRNPSQRPPPGWSLQIAYIKQQLEALGLTVEQDTWTDRRELITFTNLSAIIPGARPERIILACHHDTKCTQGHPDERHNFDFVGANDGASAVAALLTLAPVLMARHNEATIQLVFFDGEESLDWNWNDGKRALFGSKRFVRRHRDKELLGETSPIAAVILLDMVGRTNLHIQEELYSTYELRELAYGAAMSLGYKLNFYLFAEAAADDHKPFLDVGIPAVDLIDLKNNPHWHKPTDTLENISAESIQKVADVVLTMLPEVEKRYVTGGS